MLVSRHRHPLHPNVRRSPYFPATENAGAVEYIVYNHMYMPMDYGRDPEEDYRALVDRVTLWDVGAERQTEIHGTDCVRLADHLCTRDLSRLEVGQCRYTLVCDDSGRIMAECVVLRPEEEAVWISHGDVDLTLWARAIALYGDYDVEVSEPDIAPLQLQGPASPGVVADLLGPEAAAVPPYRCEWARLAGTDLVVSKTGWSGEVGFELYPAGSGTALEIWNAIVKAGEPRGLLVTGPNLVRACEHTITDTHYFVNSNMDPFEAGAAWAVDLTAGPFVGRQALLEAVRRGPSRHTVGLVATDDAAVPRLESFWPVLDDASQVGEVRWGVRSIALARPIAIALVNVGVVPGNVVRISHPEGEIRARVVDLPFLDDATTPTS